MCQGAPNKKRLFWFETKTCASDPVVKHCVLLDFPTHQTLLPRRLLPSTAHLSFTDAIELTHFRTEKEAVFPEGSLGMEYLDVWQESSYPLPVCNFEAVLFTAARLNRIHPRTVLQSKK